MNVAFDVVQPRVPDGLGVYLKSAATGRIYRIEPVRHHVQPRFWVLRVLRFIRPGVADETIVPWYSSRPCTLAELPTELAAIKADVAAWLDDEAQSTLIDWIRHCELAQPAEITADGIIRPRAVTGTATQTVVETRLHVDEIRIASELTDGSSSAD
jgi:hypothetical protein